MDEPNCLKGKNRTNKKNEKNNVNIFHIIN